MNAKRAPIIRLSIKTYDAAGKLLTDETKENDIFLYNWAVLLANLLKASFCSQIAGVYTWRNLDGTEKQTVQGEFSGAASIYNHTTSFRAPNVTDSPMANLGFIQIGGGNNAPLISDFCLQTFIAEATPTPPMIVTVGNVIKIIFSTTFSFPAETVIGETGIRLAGGISQDLTAAGKYLITRDIFTPATVPQNGTVTIQHELWLNGTP